MPAFYPNQSVSRILFAAIPLVVAGCGVSPEKLCDHASKVSTHVVLSECIESASLAQRKKPAEYKKAAECGMMANNEASLTECVPLEFMVSYGTILREAVKQHGQYLKLAKLSGELLELATSSDEREKYSREEEEAIAKAKRITDRVAEMKVYFEVKDDAK